MRICIVNYSSRCDGNCAKTAQYVGDVLHEVLPADQVTVMDFPDIGNHTCGKCAYECFRTVCPYKTDKLQIVYDKIIQSDILLSVVPVYGGYPCSNFFVLNERIQGAFDNIGFEKLGRISNKYILIANTDASISKAIFHANDEDLCDEDILVLKSNDVGERSIRGNMIEFSYYRDIISNFLNKFMS